MGSGASTKCRAVAAARAQRKARASTTRAHNLFMTLSTTSDLTVTAAAARRIIGRLLTGRLNFLSKSFPIARSTPRSEQCAYPRLDRGRQVPRRPTPLCPGSCEFRQGAACRAWTFIPTAARWQDIFRPVAERSRQPHTLALVRTEHVLREPESRQVGGWESRWRGSDPRAPTR